MYIWLIEYFIEVFIALNDINNEYRGKVHGDMYTIK
jgi:hypothetical protein